MKKISQKISYNQTYYYPNTIQVGRILYDQIGSCCKQ